MPRRPSARALLALSLALSSCTPAAQNARLAPGGGEGEPAPTASASAAPVAAPFENPGGMWMPEQLASQADALRHAGFAIDAQALTKPTEFPLGAIVFLGGCSASFVSPDGLVITNHHCVTQALGYNSKPGENLLEDGFYAKTRAEERFAGPTARVFVTTGFTDVTGKVRDGLAAIADPLARQQAIEDRQKKLVSTCEAGKDGVRCSVVSYFGGAQWVLVEQLEIRDVRLVHAPPASVGNYGGEIDNWRWPRHTGDFSFYRAYVGKDGKPADHADTNVPYRPPHVLKLARTPLGAGDAVLVAGYPARTNRLTTAAETAEAVSWEYPYTIDFCEKYLAELERVAKTDEALAIKAEPMIRGLSNWLTNTRGQVDGLVKDGLAKKKADAERELMAWIEADPARRAKWGDALPRLDALFRDSKKHKKADASLRELGRMVRLFSAAQTIVKNAEERPKADEARDPDYQQRNQKRLEQSFQALGRQYARQIDAAMLRLVIDRELRLPPEERAGITEALFAGQKLDGDPKPADIDRLVQAAFDRTRLGDEATRLRLLGKATTKELAASPDPLVRLAVALRPKTKAAEDREDRYAGETSVVRPLFVEAMRERAGGKLAPDANRTLRITYGTVRGYRPTPEAPMHAPFTTLSEVVGKHTGKDPFDAPAALRDAVAQKKTGPYVDERLGDVPVDFLADLDITGGNSGSATLNARGELVGLAFDGNYEAMASDWLFMPAVTRSIHVDLRYILWVLDAVSNADPLLREMGVEPALP